MKKKARAIIVDDERLARKDLRSMLAEYPGIEVAGEADSVTAAVRLIAETSPDIIFLDIQMPGESGFDLLERVELTARVVFVTAFDEYAIRAFEVDAVDYLLKPVNPDRLRAAMERLEKEVVPAEPSKQRLEIEDSLFLSVNSRLKFIKVNAILFIQAAGDYSEIYLADGKKGLVQKKMGEWEDRLPASHFCRIHRSTVINMDCIDRVEEWFSNSYRVYLKGVETPLVMSRNYASVLKDKLG
ncbi:MAG: LytTR family DNA-binding domain-containing protein [Ignavibacteriales bacterium]|nr:LytTR family DNA-binding domain-containing protein [Ignavibacteriales bacterium]